MPFLGHHASQEQFSTSACEKALSEFLAWENWSGSLRFRAYHLSLPTSENEVLWLVQKALKHPRRLRPVGASHTSMPIFSTDDTLVSLEKMSGVIHHYEKTSTASCLPGTSILTLGKELLNRQLSPVNLGDVALQRIAGAIGRHPWDRDEDWKSFNHAYRWKAGNGKA